MTYPDLTSGAEYHERLYLRAGAEPPWVRVMHDGVDHTDRPDTWTPEDAQRRSEWLKRTARYQED
ncbi:MAG: hypothetical protein K0R99_3777 [Microbacterium sp.]|jgi:hypothetical protein|nr:hypothetical protein [Microbacterium sp.]